MKETEQNNNNNLLGDKKKLRKANKWSIDIRKVCGEKGT